MLKRRQRNHRRPRFEQMENRDLLTVVECAPASHCFDNRADFEAALGSFITDDYEQGYTEGDIFSEDDVDQFSATEMNAVFGETTYDSQRVLPPPVGSPDGVNLVFQNADSAFFGSNNSYYEASDSVILGFTSTSIGNANGVYGVGFDHNATQPVQVAVITFGDNANTSATVQIAGGGFFGIISDLRIKTIEVGTTVVSSADHIALDNLTIGEEAPAATTVQDVRDAVIELRNEGDIGNIPAIVLLNRLNRVDRALEFGNEPRAIRLLERTNRTIRIGVFFGLISQADGDDLTQLINDVIDSLEAA